MLNTPLLYREFTFRFIESFDNDIAKCNQMSKLYRKRPPVVVFITEQWALVRGLMTKQSEAQILEIVQNSICSEIRFHLYN